MTKSIAMCFLVSVFFVPKFIELLKEGIRDYDFEDYVIICGTCWPIITAIVLLFAEANK